MAIAWWSSSTGTGLPGTQPTQRIRHVPLASMRRWSRGMRPRRPGFSLPGKDDRLYAAFLLLATTGARRGEVLGLCWSDVDLGTGRAAIRQTVITVNNEAQIGEPKTARGRRTIDLDAAT